MTMADAEQLARFCREQLGDAVRAVGLVTDGTVEPTYMLEGLQSRYTEHELDGLEDAAVETAGALHGLNTYHTSLGQSHAGLFAFEDAFMHCNDELFS